MPDAQKPTLHVYIKGYAPTRASFTPSDVKSPNIPLYEQQTWLYHLILEWDGRGLLGRLDLSLNPDNPNITILDLIGRPKTPQEATQYFEEVAKATEEIVGWRVDSDLLGRVAQRMGINPVTDQNAMSLLRWIAAMRHAARR